jgi:DNA-binding beta-propeller fold protein YncE
MAPMVRRALFPLLTVALLLGSTISDEANAESPFPAFESGQVRPIALSPNGERLFVVNTPDNRLEIFNVEADGLEHWASVPVGLEPVAVAARSNNEVWVVNHLSDSVSVVAVNGGHPHVKQTLLVGDEPRDIVFAGPGRSRAFITAAHRGQNAPFDPQYLTPGIGRADVWVFDAHNPGNTLGGTPLSIISLFCDTPRALAVDATGTRVYAAGFNTGNQTTIVHRDVIPDVGFADGGPTLPNVNHGGVAEPNIPLIVKWDGTDWLDDSGRAWTDKIMFNLPDKDVFVIDASAPIPELLPGSDGYFTGVGTTLFNMIVNPVSGKVYVTNTDARNHVRFSGPGLFYDSTVRGHAVDNRITVLDEDGSHPRDLNKHIDRDNCCAELPNAESELSVSQPLGMAISADGEVLYTAVIGNDKVALYYTAELEDDMFYPDEVDQIPVSGGGPTGLVLDEDNARLYVMTRFDNGISIIDTDTLEEIDHLTLHNPEPASLVAGRRFLYDAANSSSHGDQACSSCHVFGDKDDLSWDLGNPDGDVVAPPDNIHFDLGVGDTNFHPMKGPMVTQSLRGLDNHGPMHWRGDRNGPGVSQQPNAGAFSEVAAFNAFNAAFIDLLGRSEQISAEQMQAFTDFQLQVMYPPNPNRALDNTLTASQEAGRVHFVEKDAFLNFANDFAIIHCEECHVIDPEGNAEYGVERPGFFGSDGQIIIREFTQTLKVPQLRNLYTKVGMFGFTDMVPFFNTPNVPSYDGTHQGDQIRGFGFTHAGDSDTLLRFFNVFIFAPESFQTRQQQEEVVDFLFAIDSNFQPIVGQQVTLTQNNAANVGARIDLLHARADANACELVAKTRLGALELGLVYEGGMYTPSFSALPSLTEAQVRALANSKPVTFTCAPPGSGVRIGIDRDADGYRDGDEVLAGSNPADPLDVP